MKLIFKSFFILSCVCFTTNIVAQLDTNKGTKEKGKTKSIVLKNSKEVNKPKSIELNGTDGFQKAYDAEKEKLKNEQKEDNLKNKGILTQAKLNEQRFLKSFQKINGQYIIPKIDQDLGSFRTSSKSVNIICRDFQYPDGDRVTIYVNDVPLIYNILLKTSYQKFNIPLNVGINKIAFKALNQGTSGPNTAAFKVYNDAGMLISSNEWNLATGAKATLVIAKDK
ncbi:hypothetical protein BW723_15650 [Polaribacter reichenbachii]|uniref:Secreted protein n=1 Tax=Polaribacter reichenbachii TaxID=996801 RepID=A0A1B8U5A1_9FLAO|nr:hypothetical protein [Polaribacter reichenbachii]APZ47634.1 hypothetical protein BW723_15650 [Polaribacter reichenbachii]AUC18274.1 hypothetical protein BTO17_06095 [Polaribacter reichenbachii]OBY67013.1 hypothetical protein LPB301_04135 [Polaribacter reichenbachii]